MVEGDARFQLVIDIDVFFSHFKDSFSHPESIADLTVKVTVTSNEGNGLYTRRIATEGHCPGIGTGNARVALNKALDDAIETLFIDWQFASSLLVRN